MRVHDGFVGLFFVVLGGLIVAYSFTLVPPRHLLYGPELFPRLMGSGLVLVGGIITAAGVLRGRTEPLGIRPDWARSPRQALRFWVIPAAFVFFVLAVQPLGFLLTATLILTALMAAGGRPPLKAFGIALVLAIVINIAFASLLHVPLPWGPLTPISGYLLW